MTILTLMKTVKGSPQKGGNQCGKRRNCSLRAISPSKPQCFQKTCTADMSNQGVVWERVNNPVLVAF